MNRQQKHQLKQLDARLKILYQRHQGAYEIAINDHGRALDRVQAEIDKVDAERQKLVAQIEGEG